METFEVGVKCVWTGHTFSSGEQARKCLNCPLVMRISAWQEKGRCFCGSTNTVEAIATTNNPTILTTNSRQNSRISGIPTETFEVGVKCVWTGHTFSSGEQARKCLNCPLVMRISAWQEKGRCFCGSTNTVEAIATTNSPTILTTNSRQNSRISGTSNTQRTSLNWRDTTSANSSVNSSNNPYSIDNSSAFPKWLGYIFGVGVFLFLLMSVTLHKFDGESPELNRESPDKFVKNYYSLVNNRQYSSAWNHLSDFFKNKTSVNKTGYSSYLKYWKTVKKVEILRTKVEFSSEKSATVNIQIRYFMISKNKTVDESLRLFLVWDANDSKWVINNTEYSS